jgi:WD40 repeat protein
MSVAAPPRLPRTSAPVDPEALIEEARRRARRRRLWYAAAVLLAGAGLLALFGPGHGGGGASRPTARGGSHPSVGGQSGELTQISPVAQPGQLTMIGVPSHNGHGPGGWYDFSTVVGGRLHPFVRCEYKAGWCGDVTTVAWAPDGTRLAFAVTSFGGTAQFNGLHVLTLRTRRDFWTLMPRSSWDVSSLQWSPAGSKLAFASSGSIYVLAVNALRVRRVRTGTPDGAFDYSPSWSSDGTRLVFATKQNRHSSISVINLDGSRRTLLARHASDPAWSPDGKTIAYRTSCGIKLVTPRGKDVTPANPPYACHAIGLAGSPLWSLDGRRIVILNAHSFTPGTFVIDADGRHLRLLTHATGQGVSPAFRGQASWQPQPRT